MKLRAASDTSGVTVHNTTSVATAATVGLRSSPMRAAADERACWHSLITEKGLIIHSRKKRSGGCAAGHLPMPVITHMRRSSTLPMVVLSEWHRRLLLNCAARACAARQNDISPKESTARTCAARQNDISPKESTARTCAAHACAARTDR